MWAFWPIVQRLFHSISYLLQRLWLIFLGILLEPYYHTWSVYCLFENLLSHWEDVIDSSLFFIDLVLSLIKICDKNQSTLKTVQTV
jgi:hypothetical protein